MVNHSCEGVAAQEGFNLQNYPLMISIIYPFSLPPSILLTYHPLTPLFYSLSLSSPLSLPFPQPLVTTIKDMMSEVRESIAEKRSELDNLPLETGRIDLISYASSPPCQYTLVFPSQRIRNAWEQDFLLAKTKADEQAPPTVNVAPPKSPPPTSIGISQALEFAHPILLQSGRVGTKVRCEVFVIFGMVMSQSFFLE